MPCTWNVWFMGEFLSMIEACSLKLATMVRSIAGVQSPLRLRGFTAQALDLAIVARLTIAA
jgi:hypothetical protein